MNLWVEIWKRNRSEESEIYLWRTLLIIPSDMLTFDKCEDEEEKSYLMSETRFYLNRLLLNMLII